MPGHMSGSLLAIPIVCLCLTAARADDEQFSVRCTYTERLSSGERSDPGQLRFTFDLTKKLYQMTYEKGPSIFSVRGNGVYRIRSFDDLKLETRYERDTVTESEVFDRMSGKYSWTFQDTQVVGIVRRVGECTKIPLEPIKQGVF
jgi:hypothetical protein